MFKKFDIVTDENPLLRKKCEKVETPISEEDKQLALDMLDYVKGSQDEKIIEEYGIRPGIGLAAPQIGLAIRLFVIDATPMKEDFPEIETAKRVFINPEIIDHSEETIAYEEGCLSVPGIHEKVTRPTEVTVHYFDENFVEHTETFKGFFARIVQHEYDHLEGHVFTDRVSPLRRQMIGSKLQNIQKGKVRCSYKTK